MTEECSCGQCSYEPVGEDMKVEVTIKGRDYWGFVELVKL